MKNSKIHLPKGVFCGGDCCADCIYFDKDHKISSQGDKGFCAKDRDWRYPTDDVARCCRNFRKR